MTCKAACLRIDLASDTQAQAMCKEQRQNGPIPFVPFAERRAYMNETKQKLSLGRILAFASCDIFGGGGFNIINFLYPGYIVLAVGLPAYMAGILIMITRVFDAVIDPFIGFFSDKLRVRFGTRRGSMLVCAPLIILSLFLMFFPHNNSSQSVRFFFVLLSCLFYYTVQSMVMIPYFSLSTELTEDYTERARMTTFRLGFSIFSSIVCVALPGIIINAYDGNRGYIAMSLIFGCLFAICAAITGLFAKEGVPAPARAEPLRFKSFYKPFKVKPFRQYLYILITCQITMALMSGLFFFYVDFYFCRDITINGGESMVGMLGAAIMFGMQIVALPIYMAMIKKRGKMPVYILGALIWIVSALFLLLIPANSNPALLYALAAVMGFGISGPGLIPHAIFSDVVDAGHLQLSERSAGSFSGISNLLNTVAQAVGLAFAMAIIGAAGFVEQDIGKGAMKIVSQPESAQRAIVLIMALAPLLFMSVGAFICTRYKLNRDMHTRILTAIDGSDEEKAEVLKLLKN